MESSIGTRLRSQREQQQIPLADIAERTKIKLSLLEALERGDVSLWPTGIFRRSFVRAYAQAIGLDADAVLREFLDLYPEPVDEDVTAALVAAREGRRPPTRLGYLISSAISALPVRRKAAAPEPAQAAAETTPAGALDDVPSFAETFESGPHEQPAAAIEMAMDAGPGLFEDDPSPGDAQDGWRLAPAPASATAGSVDLALSFDQPPCDEPAAPPMAFAALAPRSAARRAGRDVPDFAEVAELCTRLARALQPREVVPVLEDFARLVDAVGLIVWMWDPATRTLGHALAHGYSHDVLSRLPRVRWDTDNAIADAFRSAETRVVRGSGTATGAVVVPLVTGAGCAGVLALELQDRAEEREWVRGVAAIVAAQMAALFGFPSLAEAVGA